MTFFLLSVDFHLFFSFPNFFSLKKKMIFEYGAVCKILNKKLIEIVRFQTIFSRNGLNQNIQSWFDETVNLIFFFIQIKFLVKCCQNFVSSSSICLNPSGFVDTWLPGSWPLIHFHWYFICYWKRIQNYIEPLFSIVLKLPYFTAKLLYCNETSIHKLIHCIQLVSVFDSEEFEIW